MKTIRYTEIPEFENRNKSVPICECVESIIQDIYTWGEKNNYTILNYTFFPLIGHADMIISYEPKKETKNIESLIKEYNDKNPDEFIEGFKRVINEIKR